MIYIRKKVPVKTGTLFDIPKGKGGLYSPCNLTRAQATSANIYMCRSAVDDSLYASDIGLPCSVCPSVRVGDLDAESHAFATDITFCHSSAPPYTK